MKEVETLRKCLSDLPDVELLERLENEIRHYQNAGIGLNWVKAAALEYSGRVIRDTHKV